MYGKPEFPVSVVTVDDFPVAIRSNGKAGSGSKWNWMRNMIVNEMGKEALVRGKSVRRLEFKDKALARAARAAAYTCSPLNKHPHQISFDSKSGYEIMTRIDPIAGDSTAGYFFFVKVTVGGK